MHEYDLCCDFGYDITSPIPAVEPVHKNFHCLVPAVAGTTVELFPGVSERYEYAEFVSCLTDENSRNIGMKCRIMPSPKLMKFFGGLESMVWEVDLFCGKEVFTEDSRYDNGKNTHTYRRLLLQETTADEAAVEEPGSAEEENAP